MADLASFLMVHYQLPQSQAEALGEQFQPCRVGLNEYLLRAGERDRYLYFVGAGLLRVFYSLPDGREYNKAFLCEGMFFVALSAYLQEQPARFSVQALEDTKLVRMPYQRFQDWCDQDSALTRLWRRYMEAHFLRHEAREAVLQLEDAQGRYRWFLDTYPGLAERLSLYHIASYLGMTDVTLSRVRRQIAGN